MQCWQCGASVRSGAKLCVYCGANLVADTDDAGAGAQNRSSRNARPGRDSADRRSSREAEWDDPSAERGARQPYSSGRRPRDADQAGYYGGRDVADTGRDSRDSYRRGRRDERDPLADPRAPQSVRSTPTRDAGSSRRGSQPRDDRWGASDRSDRDDDYRERRSSRSRPERYDDGERWEPRGRQSNERFPERGRSGRDSTYSAPSEYSDEYPAQGWRDERAAHNAPGRLWRDADDQDRSPRAAYAESAIGDSWGMPAAPGWTDESASIPASPSRRGAKRGKDKSEGRTTKKVAKRIRLALRIASILITLLTAAIIHFNPTILSRLHGSLGNTCAASSSAATPGPAPTPPANYKLYIDKQAGYSVPYPSSWSATSGTDTSQAQSDVVTRFTESSPNAVFTIERTPSFDCETNTQIISSEVLGGQQVGETFTEIPNSASAQTVSGEQCLRKEYSVMPQSKSGLRMSIIACHHAGKGYAFVIFSDSSAYTQTYSSVFQTMLSDFRFTS